MMDHLQQDHPSAYLALQGLWMTTTPYLFRKEGAHTFVKETSYKVNRTPFGNREK